MISSTSLINAAAAVVSGTRLIDLYEFVRANKLKGRVRILQYHRISPIYRRWSHSYVLSPSSFKRQLEFLKTHFQVIDLRTVVDYLAENRPFPPFSVVITFDDGYKDTFDFAFPILKKYGVPATLFVNTEPLQNGRMYWYDELYYQLWHARPTTVVLRGIGSIVLKNDPKDRVAAMSRFYCLIREKPPAVRNSILAEIRRMTGVEVPKGLGDRIMLGWDDVRAMKRSGIEIGSHAVSHSMLSVLSKTEMVSEVADSKRILEDGLQDEVLFFSYPNGRNDGDIRGAVKTAGYRAAVTTSPCLIDANTDRYQLGRILPGDDQKTFRFFVSGMFSDVYNILPLDRKRPREDPAA